MQTAALALYSEPDIVDILIDASMPWLMLACFISAIVLTAYLIIILALSIRPRSPVERLIRRRGA